MSGGLEDVEKKEPKRFPSARPACYAVNAYNMLRTQSRYNQET